MWYRYCIWKYDTLICKLTDEWTSVKFYHLRQCTPYYYMINTNCSLVKVVYTLLQILVRQFAERIILGYQWYVWWWQRQTWKNSDNTLKVSYCLGGDVVTLGCPARGLYFTSQDFGNHSLRRIDGVLWQWRKWARSTMSLPVLRRSNVLERWWSVKRNIF